MSFGNRMRPGRAQSLVVAALIGSAGLLAASTPANIVQEAREAAARQAPTVSREYVAERPAAKRPGKSVQNRLKRTGWDSRKARRRLLMELAGRENTGRQWIRVRRSVRAGEFHWLLSTPADDLRSIRDSGLRLVLAPL